MNKSDIIILLGKMSKTKNHELLLDLLEYYNKNGLCEITENETNEFLKIIMEER